MKTLKFNTNIKCGGCVAALSPALNGEKQIEKWEVDINVPNRPLTVTTDLTSAQVVELVQKAGYQASES